jgi:hypothetical protein
LDRRFKLLYITPRLLWFLQVRLLFVLDNRESSCELAASQNVEATLHFFLCVLVRDATERHLVEALLLSVALLASIVFKLVLGLVPNLLGLVSSILFNQSLFVIHLHVDWVVHKSFPITN